MRPSSKTMTLPASAASVIAAMCVRGQEHPILVGGAGEDDAVIGCLKSRFPHVHRIMPARFRLFGDLR